MAKSKRYEQSLHPMSKEEFSERNELSRKAIEENNLIDQEEAKSCFARKDARLRR